MKTTNLLTTLLIFSSLFLGNVHSQIKYLEKEWQNDLGTNLPETNSDFEIDINGNLIFLSKDNGNLKISCVGEYGNLIWQQIINNQIGEKIGIDVEIATDNSILVLTQVDNTLNSTLFIQKLSNTGSLIWQSTEVMPLNSKGIKLKINNNDVHILSSKSILGKQRIQLLKKNLSNGTGNGIFVQNSSENFDFNPIDFIYDNTGKLIILSHKFDLLSGYSHLLKLGTNLNQLSSQVLETTSGNHIPTTIRSYLSFCVVGGQTDFNGKHASINVLNMNSLTIMGSGLNDLPLSIYKDFEVLNNQVFATGYFKDSLDQNRIFIESATLIGQSTWRKVISSPINDINFEGIDLITTANGKIYVIAKGAIDITLSEDWLVYELNISGDLTNKFFLDRTSQSDINSKILATPNGLYISGQTKDVNDSRSSLVKIRTATADTIPNVDNESSSRYDGYIRNYGQLKNYGPTNTSTIGVNYYSSNPHYLDALMKDKIALVQNQKVDTFQWLYDVNRVDISFVNGNMEKQIEQNPNGLKRNYYQGNTNKSIVDVDEYESVYIPSLYENIDLKLTHNKVGVKMIFAKNVKGELEDIEININGASSFEIDNNKLTIITSINTIDFDQPSAYQYNGSGTLVQYPAYYVINSLGNVTIDVPIYNPSNTLYIVLKDGNDPTPTPKLLGDNMMWSTYFGEEAITISRDVATDENNNVYYTGQTTCQDFLNSTGLSSAISYEAAYDAFIIKFSELIIPKWFTYYGGSVGNNAVVSKPSEVATDIWVKGNGSKIYIAGETQSADLLQANNSLSIGYTGDQINSSALGPDNKIYRDLFIAHFQSNGQIFWNTYYGNDYDEFSLDITLDKNDNLYVVGERNNTTPLLTLAGASNYTSGLGLLLKFNNDDVLTWVNSWDGDRISAVVTDPFLNVYFAGSTSSLSMPVLNAPVESQTQNHNGGNHDGYLASFNGLGILTHGMYYGGNCGDFITGLGINNAYEIYAIGKTAYKAINNNICTGSTNLIVKGNGIPSINSISYDIDHFIFKMNPFFNGFTPQQAVIAHAGYFGGGGSEFEGNGEYGLSYTEAVISVHPISGIFAISGASNSDYINYSTSIPMPFAQPQNYFFQPYKDEHTNFGFDAYLATFNSDFELKYSTYFGDGHFSEGASSIAFSIYDNRLYFCGNTGTFNEAYYDASTPEELLYVEEFDDSPGSLDFYQSDYPSGNPTMSEATWFAFFDMNGLDIPGIPFTLGVNENGQDELLIYPNPSSSNIQISSSTILEEIYLYDLQGKLILQISPQSLNCSIDVSTISNGTYIIQAKSLNGILTSKFVKQ